MSRPESGETKVLQGNGSTQIPEGSISLIEDLVDRFYYKASAASGNLDSVTRALERQTEALEAVVARLHLKVSRVSK